MKKFRFTLKSVLEYRKTLEELARAALIQSREKLRLAEAAVVAAEAEISAVYSGNGGGAMANCGSFFIQRERHLKILREKIHKLEFNVMQLKAEVELNMAKLQEAMREVKKMERLSEKELEAWTAEFMHEEQKINDEIANSRSCFPVNAKVGA